MITLDGFICKRDANENKKSDIVSSRLSKDKCMSEELSISSSESCEECEDMQMIEEQQETPFHLNDEQASNEIEKT